MSKRIQVTIDLSKALGALGVVVIVAGAAAYDWSLGVAAFGVLLVAGALSLHGRSG